MTEVLQEAPEYLKSKNIHDGAEQATHSKERTHCKCWSKTCLGHACDHANTSRRFSFKKKTTEHPGSRTPIHRNHLSASEGWKRGRKWDKKKENRGGKEIKNIKLSAEIIKRTLKFRISWRRKRHVVFRGPSGWKACGLTFTAPRKGCSSQWQIHWGWCREDWVVVRVGCLGDPVHDTTSGSPPRTAWARPGHHTARWMILTGPYNRPVHCTVDSDPLSEVNQKLQNKHIFSFLLNHELKLHCFYSEIIFIRT